MINLAKVTVVPAVGGMIVDIWLFVLPLVPIYRLQLHGTRRVRLTIMFSTNLFFRLLLYLIIIYAH